MPKFAVEIGIGVNESELAQAEKAYKRLGVGAEDALKKVEGLADKSNKGGEEIRAAAVKAAASFERFAKSVEAGGRGSERELVKLNVRIDELRSKIEAAKRSGAPVSNDAINTLRALESQTQDNVQALGRLKAAQDDVADSVRASKGDFDGQGRQINSLSDIFDVAGGKVGKFGLQVIAAAGAFKAGYDIGNQFREMLDGVGREIFGVTDLTNKMVRATSTYAAVALAVSKIPFLGGGPGAVAKDAARYEEILRKFKEIQSRRVGGLADPYAQDEQEYIEWYLDQQKEIAARQKKITEEMARTRAEMEKQHRAAEASFKTQRGSAFFGFNSEDSRKKTAALVADVRQAASVAGNAWATELEKGIQHGMDAGAQIATEEAQAWIDRGQQIAAYVAEPLAAAWQSTRDLALDTLTAMAMGQKIEWESLVKDWLAMWFRAMAEWLARWIATQAAAQAASAGTGAMGGGGGGGGGWMNMLGGMFGGGGGGGGAAAGGASSGAAMAGWAAAFIAVVAILKNQSKTSGRLEADTSLQFGGEGGISIAKELSRYNSKEVLGRYKQQIEAMKKMIADIAAFIEDLGGTLDKMAPKSSTLTVGREGQGKKTNWFVKYADGLVKHFGNDAQAAFDFAMVQAIKQAPTIGLSPEVAAAIKNSTAEKMEDLQKEIDAALSVVRARLGDTGSQVFDLFRSWSEEIKAASELGLAIDGLIAARDREFSSLRNQLLGIDTSTADALAALLSFQRGVEEVANSARAVAEHNLAAAQGTLDSLLASGPRTSTTQGPLGPITRTQSREDFEREIADLRAQVARYVAELDKIPQALSEQEIDMGIFQALYQYVQGSRKYEEERVKWAKLKVELEFAAIKAQLIALGKWEEFAGLFTDAYNAAQGAAGKPLRAGGGGGRRQGVRDFIADRGAALDAAGLGDYARAVSEINRLYAEQMEQAGNDKKLRAELIALKKEELAQLAQERAQAVTGKFREFMGLVTPFDKVRETAAELVKEIQDSPFGSERKARMITRVLGEVERQIDRMARQSAVGLFGQMLSDMEKFGATEEQMAEARKQMAIIEHTLKLEHYRAEIEILRAQGKLSEKTLAALDGALKFLEGVDPTKILGGGGGIGSTGPNYEDGTWMWTGAGWVKKPGTETSAAQSDLDRAKKMLEEWKRAGIHPLTRDLQDLATDFAFLKKHLGDTIEVQAAYAARLHEILDRYLDPIREFREGRQLSNLSTLTGEGQFYEAQRQFREAMQAVLGGDLTKLDSIVSLAQQYGELGQGFTAGEGVRFIMKEIDDAMDLLLSQVPGIAGGLSGAPLGAASNPMTIQSAALVGAINTGNGMVIDQMRSELTELQAINRNTRRTAELLETGVLSTREIA